MEIKIKETKENSALNRKELKIEIEHNNESTPKRSEVKAKLAAEEGLNEDLIIVNELHTEFGAPETVGYVKVYDNKESLEEIENKYEIKRNMG